MRPGVTPAQHRAAWAVRAVIERSAVEAFGAVPVERPSTFGPGRAALGEVSALGGVRAARHAEAVAFGRVRYYAEAARADGEPWREIGAALDLTVAAEEHDRPLGELAFELIAEGREPGMPGPRWSGWDPYVTWRCSSCGERVTDRGPYDGAPCNIEQGHAPSCERHGRDIARYRATWGDDDEGAP